MLAFLGGEGLRHLGELTDMFVARPAATADNLHPQILDEVHQRHPQFHWRQPVVSLSADVFRQSGIGNAGDDKGGMFREVADVFLHQIRTGGAVEAEDIDAVGFENGDHGANFRSDQHGAEGFHGHRYHDWQPRTFFGKDVFDSI